MTMDGIARGLARQTFDKLSASGAATGAALVGFLPAPAGANATNVQSKLRERVSAFDFMTPVQIASVRARDGVQDVTAALQAAINATLSTTGGNLYLPSGVYKITDELLIPQAWGWTITGSSRFGTVIRQYTSNKAIVRFRQDLMMDWTIESLTFTYNSQQTGANPTSIALSFGGAAANFTAFDWTVRDCYFQKCWRGLGVEAANPFVMWGFQIDNCRWENTCQGAAIYINGVAGQPRMLITNNLFDMAAATEHFVQVQVADSLTMINNEWLHGGPTVRCCQIGSASNMVFMGNRSEFFNSGATGSPTPCVVFGFADCNIAAISNHISGMAGALACSAAPPAP